MPINNMAWNWNGGYAGGSGASYSMQVNFDPQMAVALASLNGADGDGLCLGGVTQYRTRTDPSGPDQDHDIGWDPNFGYPPLAYDPIMTSVTATLELGAHQEGVMALSVWLWG